MFATGELLCSASSVSISDSNRDHHLHQTRQTSHPAIHPTCTLYLDTQPSPSIPLFTADGPPAATPRQCCQFPQTPHSLRFHAQTPSAKGTHHHSCLRAAQCTPAHGTACGAQPRQPWPRDVLCTRAAWRQSSFRAQAGTAARSSHTEKTHPSITSTSQLTCALGTTSHR